MHKAQLNLRHSDVREKQDPITACLCLSSPKTEIGVECATQKQQWEARGGERGQKTYIWMHYWGHHYALGGQSHLGSSEECTGHLSEMSTQNQHESTYILAPKHIGWMFPHLQAEHICWWVSSYWCQRCVRDTRGRKQKTIEGKLLEAHSVTFHHCYS